MNTLAVASIQEQRDLERLAAVVADLQGRLEFFSQTCGERLLTVEELASRLQLSIDTTRDHVNAGQIPLIRLNSRTWRFHWPTVLAAMKTL